jgi:hypothetical protein
MTGAVELLGSPSSQALHGAGASTPQRPAAVKTPSAPRSGRCRVARLNDAGQPTKNHHSGRGISPDGEMSRTGLSGESNVDSVMPGSSRSAL